MSMAFGGVLGKLLLCSERACSHYPVHSQWQDGFVLPRGSSLSSALGSPFHIPPPLSPLLHSWTATPSIHPPPQEGPESFGVFRVKHLSYQHVFSCQYWFHNLILKKSLSFFSIVAEVTFQTGGKERRKPFPGHKLHKPNSDGFKGVGGGQDRGRSHAWPSLGIWTLSTLSGSVYILALFSQIGFHHMAAAVTTSSDQRERELSPVLSVRKILEKNCGSWVHFCRSRERRDGSVNSKNRWEPKNNSYHTTERNRTSV